VSALKLREIYLRFNAVVTSAGRYLPPLIATFISHLEERQKEKYGEMQGKKKYNAKVAQKRVLRESDTFARTMLENERFSKAVFQLSAKLKVKKIFQWIDKFSIEKYFRTQA
jgi:FANCI solenoid 4